MTRHVLAYYDGVANHDTDRTVMGDEFVADIAHALVAAVRSKRGDWICALLGSAVKCFLVANIYPLYRESLDIGFRQRVVHDGRFGQQRATATSVTDLCNLVHDSECHEEDIVVLQTAGIGPHFTPGQWSASCLWSTPG